MVSINSMLPQATPFFSLDATSSWNIASLIRLLWLASIVLEGVVKNVWLSDKALALACQTSLQASHTGRKQNSDSLPVHWKLNAVRDACRVVIKNSVLHSRKCVS
jgi:hypothetical protein